MSPPAQCRRVATEDSNGWIAGGSCGSLAVIVASVDSVLFVPLDSRETLASGGRNRYLSLYLEGGWVKPPST